MKKKVTQELIEKFFERQCTPDEERMVLKWLKNQPEETHLQKIVQDWEEFDEKKIVSGDLFEPHFGELEKKMSGKQKFLQRTPWMKVAASLLLLAVASSGIFFYYQYKENAYITKYTENEHPSIFTFADGSKVTLSPGSILRYPAKFASNKPVYLEGEAYFDISSTNEVTVYAGNVKAKASQSSFNISAFPGDKEVVVSVLEGHAEVTGDKEIIPLMKLQMPKTLPLTKLIPAVKVSDNEYLAFNKDSNTLSKGEDFDPKEVSAWKEGIVYFNNADSAKMIKKLERWYGVDITVNGCLGQQFFSGEYANQSLDEILTTIKTNTTSQLEYSREGNRILIRGVCI